jgi:ATP-dependent DNA helicase PIF1
MTTQLNAQQQAALAAVCEGRNVFLTGPGGVGKSFLIRHIVDTLTERNRNVAVTALTGCAALLLGKNAKTIHSWAGIGLGKEPASKICAGIKKYAYKTRRRWLTTHTLIIDEVSMMTPEVLELLNDVAQTLRCKPVPFGGMQVILVGDFFQLPPVNKTEDPATPTRFVFESPVWKDIDLRVVELNEIVRQADPVFQKILMEARQGQLTKPSLELLEARRKEDWQTLKIRPTLLFSRRAEVDMINDANLRAIKTPSHIYKVKTVFNATIPKGNAEDNPDIMRAVTKLDRDAPYKQQLELKVGTQVMLIYNLDPEKGLVNGSRGVVEGFTDLDMPLVLFKGHSAPMEVDMASWESEDMEGLHRQQIPLILAYAITIHRCQGATLDSALVDIGPRTFEMGQAYVALSRVKSLECLYIYDLEAQSIKAHNKVIAFYQTLRTT